MSSESKTFSESWYRIADRHVVLAPHVEVKRQVLRGERFHLLRNPYTNAYFRLRPAAYAFVSRLRQDRTVDAVWRECLEADPENAPGQEQALRLLVQLHAAHLLQSDLPPDAIQTFERYRVRKNKELRSTASNILFARIPVLNPDTWLRRAMPLIRAVLSRWGLAVWVILMAVAVKTLVDHATEFAQQSEGLLAPGNLPWLFLALGMLKLIHETGHATMCRRFGGEVPTVGVMLMLLTPVPYVDTTSSWGFRRRYQRVLVGLAGMLFESVIGAIAVLVWANTAAGALHSIAYNVILVATIATVLFNINPLLRFDGYYILADLLEIPNLQTRSIQQVKYFAEKYLLGNKSARPPLASRREAVWLTVYGLASQAYRLLLSASILLFLATRYLLLGQILFVIGLISWVLLPVAKLGWHLFTSPQLMRSRPRAVATCFAILVGVWLLLSWVPVPRSLQAPGVLQSVQDSPISARAPGKVAEVMAPSGALVKQGAPLLRLENDEVAWQIHASEAELQEAIATRQRAQEQDLSDLEPIARRIAAVQKQLTRLKDDQASLIIRAPHDGVWVSAEAYQMKGSWLPRGIEVGRLIDPTQYQFSAVISQEQASDLFAGKITTAAVRLKGEGEHDITVKTFQAIPAEQERLPSAALGWAAGGEVATSGKDQEGMRTRDPFFEVRSPIVLPTEFTVRHGCSGRIRFDLPAEPLGAQWMRKLRQLLQRRGLS